MAIRMANRQIAENALLIILRRDRLLRFISADWSMTTSRRSGRILWVIHRPLGTGGAGMIRRPPRSTLFPRSSDLGGRRIIRWEKHVSRLNLYDKFVSRRHTEKNTN